MPNPKRRHSKSRRDKRRTYYKLKKQQLSKCYNCGTTVLYHRVCPECGYYRRKLAIEKEVTV